MLPSVDRSWDGRRLPSTFVTPAETLLEQSRQQLARQEAKLDAIRGQTGVLVTGAGVVAGFIAPTLGSKHPGWAVPALISFVICTIGGVFVFFPRHGLVFDERLDSYTKWINDHGDDAGADISFAASLASNLEANREQNKSVVEGIALLASGVAVLFGLEVVLWVIGLLTS